MTAPLYLFVFKFVSCGPIFSMQCSAHNWVPILVYSSQHGTFHRDYSSCTSRDCWREHPRRRFPRRVRKKHCHSYQGQEEGRNNHKKAQYVVAHCHILSICFDYSCTSLSFFLHVQQKSHFFCFIQRLTISITRLFDGFVSAASVDPKDGPALYFSNPSQPKAIAQLSLYTFQVVLSDMFIIYRVYIIWLRSKPVVVFPIFSLLLQMGEWLSEDWIRSSLVLTVLNFAIKILLTGLFS